MKTPVQIFKLTCLLTACLFYLGTASVNAQVKKMSAKDLTDESTVVVYGKCSRIKSEWNDKKDLIFTYVTIVPEEYLKGNLGSEAVILVPGGRVGDIIYEVSETPVFYEGEEVAAFIWTNPAGKNLVVGGYQGKMKITNDSNGKRIVEGFGLDEEAVTEGEGKVSPGQLRKVSLDDFTAKVKGYMKN